jgi:hypothetical protein
MEINYNDFNWINYLRVNPDLSYIINKEDAWIHWLNHGLKEESPISNINNTFIHNGRLGNLFFINMALHFVSLKFNLKCEYKYSKKFNKLGIFFNSGNNEYSDEITLTDDNFIDIIKGSNYIKSNIILNNENWFQSKYFVEYLKIYFNIPYIKNQIIENNNYKKRYNSNNDLFIHVRLGDIEYRVENIINYYKIAISKVKFATGFISSDSINHNICRELIDKFNLIVIDKDEIDTIMFASTCKYVILSGGTYSWLIGFFSFFSNIIFYPLIKKCWYGQIFEVNNWNSIKFD